MRVSGALMERLGSLLSAIVLVAACDPEPDPPTGQIVLSLDTDAPLASPVAGAADPQSPAPLFDRVTVEIFPPDASEPCPECSRELSADRDLMRAGRFSFGVAPTPRTLGVRARLRLFRSVGRATPRPESTVELVGYLPAVAEEGIVELTAFFRTDDVGRPRGSLDAPIIFDRGLPMSSAEGSWPGASVTDCLAAAPEGAVCVPGGAFWMGDPRVNLEANVGGRREHLVVVAPFFLDAVEVTVGAFRESGLAEFDSRGRAVDPRDDTDDPIAAMCDYTSEPGPNEDRPVMCVSWPLARAFCEARGGDLPTEAQFEFVASRRGTTLHPWGNGEPTCEEAVAARHLAEEDGGCGTSLPLFDPVLAEPAGRGTLDSVNLRTGAILDLGANLSEWARDAFQQDDEPCWTEVLLFDPQCAEPGRYEETRSTKGGNLRVIPVDYAQARRGSIAEPFVTHTEVGFRCAYPSSSPLDR